MPRPIHAFVDPSAIAANLHALRRRLSPADGGRAPRIWATVKADAYGHGIARAVPALAAADGLAVLDVDDAQACRDAGWNGPLLLLGGLQSPADLAQADVGPLHLAITAVDQLEWLAASPPHRPPFVWLRSRGDLHHCGLSDADYLRAWERAGELVAAGVAAGVGHMNHYANADAPTHAHRAHAAFTALAGRLPGPRSTCNSAALLACPELAAHDDWVRPGLALFGASPLARREAADFGLRPAMTVNSSIIAVQHVTAGQTVGYGQAYTARHDMRIGIVACGYGDGYPRGAPTGTPVLVEGVRTGTVGRVSMDTLAVDLTPVPCARPGSRVVLWGAAALPAESVAEAAGTIAAQLFTGLTPRVPVRTPCAARGMASA